MTSKHSVSDQMRWRWYHTMSVIVIVLLIVLIGTAIIPWPLTKSNPGSTLGTWWAIMILFTFFVFIVGHGITGRIFGALIDEQNRMSLARLQLVIWTIVILSAWLTSLLWNILVNKEVPLAIALPSQVWLLLGINTATLVGTPLVLDPKKSKTPNEEEAKRQFALKAWSEGIKPPSDGELSVTKYMEKLKISLNGQVPVNDSFDQANLGDLFRGEEIGNFVQLDMSKIQMFFFTLILVLTYAIALGTMFANLTIDPKDTTMGITSLPPLDQSMIVLLGISQAGYLTNQAIPHSTPPTAPSPTTTP